MAIGYSTPVKAAVPIANIAFLPLAFAGGMLMPPAIMPGWMQSISVWVPTRNWIEVALAPANQEAIPTDHLLRLVAWGIVLGIAAVLAYRRDEGQRFT